MERKITGGPIWNTEHNWRTKIGLWPNLKEKSFTIRFKIQNLELPPSTVKTSQTRGLNPVTRTFLVGWVGKILTRKKSGQKNPARVAREPTLVLYG